MNNELMFRKELEESDCGLTEVVPRAIASRHGKTIKNSFRADDIRLRIEASTAIYKCGVLLLHQSGRALHSLLLL